MIRVMSERPRLADLLACPACGGRLTASSCLSCRLDFPMIAGIPWMMPEPRAALIEWRGRLHYLLTHYATEASRQRAALEQASQGRLTRMRLDHVANALDDQANRIRALLTPLGSAARRVDSGSITVRSPFPMARRTMRCPLRSCSRRCRNSGRNRCRRVSTHSCSR